MVGGPIALMGSGEFEPWGVPFERAMLEASTGDGSVAIVPAASAPEEGAYQAWASKGLDHFSDLGVPARVVELRSRADAEIDALARDLERAGLIFFSGGNPAFLARLLAGSLVWDAVVAAVDRGAAFVGCSAGACVAGEFAPDSMTEHIWEDRWHPGLRLVPDVWVIPHFDALDRHRRGARDYFLSRVPLDGWALGVDERTAAVCLGGRWTVHGLGSVFVARRDVAARFAGGAGFPMDVETWPAVGNPTASTVAVLDALPPGAGPIGLLSSEQLSAGSASVDRELIRRAGPRLAIVTLADPSNATALERQARAHVRSIDAELVAPDDLDLVDVLVLVGGDPGRLVPRLIDADWWGRALDRWRSGMALAGSSAGAMALCEWCLLPEEGRHLPTIWAAGLGPLRRFGLAVHAASRPEEWLAEVASCAPVPVVRLDDGTGLVLAPSEPPMAIGEGDVSVVATGAPSRV